MADAPTAPATATPTATTEVAPPSSTPAVVATPSPETPPKAEAAPVSPEPAQAPAAAQEVQPTAKPTEEPKPLFTLPEHVKLPPEATSKFETFLKGKLVDGKVVLTSQEVVDQFIEQAADANARWMKQIEAKNTENEAACKSRFTPAQLSTAETAVGWASSMDPSFREFAKGQLNDPTFVNFMRAVGEKLSEDEFEMGTLPSAPQRRQGPMSRKEAGQILYGKPKSN